MAKVPNTVNTGGIRRVRTETYSPGATPKYNSTDVYSVVTSTQDSLVSYYSVNGVKPYKAPNRHSFEHIYHEYNTGTLIATDRSGTSWTRVTTDGQLGSLPYFPSRDLALRDQAYNVALGIFNDRIRGTIDLAVDIAQAGQVKGMMRNTLDLVSYVRRHPTKALQEFYKDFLRNPKKLGGKWLEFQYGWKPLAQTVFDCATKVIDDSPRMAKVEAQGTQVQDFMIITNQGQGWVDKTKVHRSARTKIQAIFDVKQSAINTISEYTSLNPASIAWELTPYSFVVDWVYDLGSYIRNMETALLTATVFRNGFTSEGYLQQTWHTQQQNFVSPLLGRYRDVKGSTKWTKFDRTPNYVPPFPRPPQFKAVLGSGRLLNAAALLSQFLGDSKR
jgi:hypothetical protein